MKKTLTSKIVINTSINEAKDDLARRGMKFTEESFLRYIKSNNPSVVNLYLRAGISPNASLDGESALAASTNRGYKPIIKMLLDAGAEPIGIIDGLRINEPKCDVFDRLTKSSGVLTFFSSIMIAGVGWYFTHTYNTRQLELVDLKIEQIISKSPFRNADY